MSKLALYVPLEAKPGKEKEVAEFLKSALPLVDAEPGTISWFAIQNGPSSFAIFDTFNDEAGRNAHLNGKVAGADGKSRRTAGQTAIDSQDRHFGAKAPEVTLRNRDQISESRLLTGAVFCFGDVNALDIATQ